MPKFLIQSTGINIVKRQLYNIPPAEPDDFDEFDKKQRAFLGTPVYSNLIFDAKTYVLYDGTEIDFGGLRIDTVLLEVSQPKNIVKTTVQGRNGTVKEYISDGDFLITVRGSIIADAPLTYPKDDVTDLITILEIPDAIDVTSEFLNWFGIGTVVVEQYRLPQLEGSRNVQPFEITMSSDQPIELQINDDQLLNQ